MSELKRLIDKLESSIADCRYDSEYFYLIEEATEDLRQFVDYPKNNVQMQSDRATL